MPESKNPPVGRTGETYKGSPQGLTQAQEAHLKAINAVTEKVAMGLKDKGAIVDIALLGGANISAPQKDEEYLRIANELIEKRQFTIKDKKGAEKTIKLSDLDAKLKAMSEAPEAKKDYEEITNKIKAKTFDQAIPNASKRSKIAEAVHEGVEKNTGFFKNIGNFFSALFEVIMNFISGKESKGLFDIMKRNTADNVAKYTGDKLNGIGLSAENINDIKASVRAGVMGEKTKGLSDIEFAPPSSPVKTSMQPDPANERVIAITPKAADMISAQLAAGQIPGFNVQEGSRDGRGPVEPDIKRNYPGFMGQEPSMSSSPVASARNPNQLKDITMGITTELMTEGGRKQVDPKIIEQTASIVQTTLQKNPTMLDPAKHKELSELVSTAILSHPVVGNYIRSDVRNDNVKARFADDATLNEKIIEGTDDKKGLALIIQQEIAKNARQLQQANANDAAMSQGNMQVAGISQADAAILGLYKQRSNENAR